MASKRAREDTSDGPAHKKARRGFSVGPQNLPDGTYKRKVDKIRRKLVENAKIKRSYDKLKVREQKPQPENEVETPAEDTVPDTRHPARQALVDNDGNTLDQAHSTDKSEHSDQTPAARRPRRPKQQLFKQEQRLASARQQEYDEKREQIAASRAERGRRLAERDRWRRTMANARGDGRRRKLGKESTVLLEKVQRIMRSEGGTG